jgi:hypothetical protein
MDCSWELFRFVSSSLNALAVPCPNSNPHIFFLSCKSTAKPPLVFFTFFLSSFLELLVHLNAILLTSPCLKGCYPSCAQTFWFREPYDQQVAGTTPPLCPSALQIAPPWSCLGKVGESAAFTHTGSGVAGGDKIISFDFSHFLSQLPFS